MEQCCCHHCPSVPWLWHSCTLSWNGPAMRTSLPALLLKAEGFNSQRLLVTARAGVMAQGSYPSPCSPGTWGPFLLQELLLRKPQGEEEQPQVPTASDSVTHKQGSVTVPTLPAQTSRDFTHRELRLRAARGDRPKNPLWLKASPRSADQRRVAAVELTSRGSCFTKAFS